MLGLNLYTLIIGHKSCNMLRILNKLTSPKDIAKFCDQNTTTTKQRINIKTLAGAGNYTRVLSHPKRMRYLCTIESTESIDCYKVKLFHCLRNSGL